MVHQLAYKIAATGCISAELKILPSLYDKSPHVLYVYMHPFVGKHKNKT